MTPSKKAKQLGCDSLAQVSKVSGVPYNTLVDWFKNRKFAFNAVCLEVSNHSRDVEMTDLLSEILAEHQHCLTKKQIDYIERLTNQS